MLVQRREALFGYRMTSGKRRLQSLKLLRRARRTFGKSKQVCVFDDTQSDRQASFKQKFKKNHGSSSNLDDKSLNLLPRDQDEEGYTALTSLNNYEVPNEEAILNTRKISINFKDSMGDLEHEQDELQQQTNSGKFESDIDDPDQADYSFGSDQSDENPGFARFSRQQQGRRNYPRSFSEGIQKTSLASYQKSGQNSQRFQQGLCQEPDQESFVSQQQDTQFMEDKQVQLRYNNVENLKRNSDPFTFRGQGRDRSQGQFSRGGRGGRGRGWGRGGSGGRGDANRGIQPTNWNQNQQLDFAGLRETDDPEQDLGQLLDSAEFRGQRDSEGRPIIQTSHEQKVQGFKQGESGRGGSSNRGGFNQGYFRQQTGTGGGIRRRGSLPLQRNPFESYSDDAGKLNRMWQINDRITRSRNLEQLWQVVETHQEELVAPHFGQILTRAFGLIDQVAPAVREGFLEYVYSLIAECLKQEKEDFPIGVLVQIYHSLGRLRWRPEEYVMFSISEAATRQMDQVNANGITKIVYGLAVSGHFDWDLLRSISLRLKHLQGSLSAYSIGIIIWSYAKMGYRDVDAIRTLCNAFSKEVSEANGRDMSQFVWSLYKLEYKSEFLLKVIADNLCMNQKLRDLQPGDIAVILYSYARQGIYSHQFFSQMCREALTKLAKMECSTVTNLTWACAKTGHLDENLFKAIGKKMYESKEELAGSDVAMVSWAFSTLHIKDPNVLRLLKEELSGEMENGRQYHSKDISQVAIAIRQFQLTESGLMEGLIKRAIPVIHELEPQGYVHILEYLTEQANPPQEVVAQLLEACHSRLNQFSTHELAKLAFCVSKLPVGKVSLIDSIAARVFDSYQPMTMIDISLCMDAFLRWGHQDLVDYLFGQSLYRLSEVSTQELAFTCQCLRKMKRHDPSVKVALFQAVINNSNQHSFKDVSMIAHSFASIHDVRPAVFEVLAERALELLTQYLDSTTLKSKVTQSLEAADQQDNGILLQQAKELATQIREDHEPKENVRLMNQDGNTNKRLQKGQIFDETIELKKNVLEVWGGNNVDLPMAGVGQMLATSDYLDEIQLNIQKLTNSAGESLEKKVISLWQSTSYRANSQSNNTRTEAEPKQSSSDESNSFEDEPSDVRSGISYILDDFEQLSKRTRKVYDSNGIDPLDLASLAWAFTSSNYDAPKLLEILQQVLTIVINDIEPADAANYLTLFARAGLSMKEIQQNLVSKILQVTDQLDNNQLMNSMVAIALTRDRLSAQTLFPAIAARFANKDSLSQLGPFGLANIIWSFGGVRIYDANLVSKVVQAASGQLEKFKEADLSRFCWGLARMRHFEPTVMEYVISQIKVNEQRRSEYDLSLLLYAFAMFSTSKYDAIFDILQSEITDNMSKYSGQALLSIMWSYGVAQKGSGQFWEALLKQLKPFLTCSDVSRISLLSINQVMQLNTFGRIGKILQKDIDGNVLNMAKQTTSNEDKQILLDQIKIQMGKMGFKDINFPRIQKLDYFEGDVTGLSSDKTKISLLLLDKFDVVSNRSSSLLRFANRRLEIIKKRGYKVVSINVQEWQEQPQEQQQQYVEQLLKLAFPNLSLS